MLNIDDRLIKEVSPKIKPNALSVLLAISIHLNKSNGTCFPSHQRLMQLTGMTRGSVYAAMEVLKKNGLLKTEQSIDTKAKTFGRRTFRVTTKLIKVFVDAEDMEPLPVSPDTAPPDTVQPHTVESETQLLNQSELINQLEQLNNGGEKAPPPAPETSNLQSQKNESGLVAPPPGEIAIKEFLSERLENLLPDAEIPPSKKVAPKKVSPVGNWEPSEFDKYGLQPLEIMEGETFAELEARIKDQTDGTFQVTAIASPSTTPGVIIVEAAPFTDQEMAEATKENNEVWAKIAQLPRVATTIEAEKKISEWIAGEGLETVKHRFNIAKQRFDPDNAAAIAAHYCSVYTKNPTNKERLLKDPITHFSDGLFGYLKTEESFGRDRQLTNQGPTRNGNQPTKTLTSNMRIL